MTTAAVICADCGRPQESVDQACSLCGGDVLLRGRYALLEELGGRGSGRTYRALDRETGADCVVKELLLRATRDLKELELFEREAEMLARLDHPRIPKLLDHCELERGKSIGLYMVLSLVPGTSLEEELHERRFGETEVASILADLLDLLAVLRSQDPPVVHRDIKPANVIRGPDGISLVDFGASRAVAETLHGAGSTVAGTFGYMAPEQLVGGADPRSDLFAVGATGIRLLTGQEPGALWSDGHRFDWDRAAHDPRLVGVVDALTAANPDRRPTDLDQLSAALREFADGNRRALSPYVGRSTIARGDDVDRPDVGPARRRFLRRSWAWVAFMAILTLGAAANAVATGQMEPIGAAVIVDLVVVGILSAFAGPWYRRWRLIGEGDIVRGVVTQRVVNAGHFRLSYRYQVAGQQLTNTAIVTEDDLLAVDVGDEVAVLYDRDRPQQSTAARLPESESR